MAECLVTGGAGFIGSHLVDALVARGHRVRVLDNFTPGLLTNLAAARHHVKIYFGDLGNLEFVRQVMKGVQLVFHLAAPAVWESGDNPSPGAPYGSVADTMHVLIAAREARVARLVYSSSCEVYGRATGSVLSESSNTRPSNGAGFSKLADEENCVAATQVYGLETVRLRLFNVFGPRQPAASPYAATLQQIVKAMLLGRSPIVSGDGLDPQDTLYVDDAVHAHLLAAETPRAAGRVFNIARGAATTPLELVDMVNALLGTNQEPVHAAPRPKCELHNLADVSRAETELGFCAITGMEQGLGHFIRSFALWQDELKSASSLATAPDATPE